MSITITEAAANHVKKMLDKRGHGMGLRLGTKVSGCTGFSYVIDYADELSDTDHIFEDYGIKVIIDAESLKNLEGTEVDFVRANALNEGFEFHNPKVKEMCGCGESFSV